MSNTSQPTDLRFPSPFAPIFRHPTTLLEQRIRRFAREIKEKPRWWEKVYDPEIVSRWMQEVVELDRKMVDELWGGDKRYAVYMSTDDGYEPEETDHYEDVDDADSSPEKLLKMWPRDSITDAQLRYLFDELRYHADQRDASTGIYQTAIPMVYESPSLVELALKAAIQQVAAKLEDVSDEQKDWHPGSNGQVLDLVHPSLYCLRIGRSFVLNPVEARGDPLNILSADDYFQSRPDMQKFCEEDAWGANDVGRVPFEYTVSRAYQWLPTDFAVSGNGAVTVRGYINNLNPSEDSATFTTISAILERFIPLFERVLSDQLTPSPPSPFSTLDPCKWYDHLQYPDGMWNIPRSPESRAWEKTHYWPRLPDAEPFQPQPSAEKVVFTLRSRTIQVIVKMANIVLSPANPTYPGGSWHVEGMSNEKIVATGLYYYDSDNITESRLAFRAAIGDGEYADGCALPGEQDDNKGFATAYGLRRGEALNQDLGHIVAREDKCVAFPNIYQHRVASFELGDRTRPGHRKIMALFLVDPFTPIHSTSQVPPQQAEWYRKAVNGASRFQQLPQELVDLILEYVLDCTVTLEEAKADREALMKERVRFVVSHNDKLFESTFNMCEH